LAPAQLELRRKDDHLITLEKTGYAPASVQIVKSVGGAVWGNILAGGLISEEEYGKGREQAIRKYMPEMLDESQG